MEYNSLVFVPTYHTNPAINSWSFEWKSTLGINFLRKVLINLKLLFTLVISNKKTGGQLNAKINLTSEIAHKKKQRKAKRAFKSLLF